MTTKVNEILEISGERFRLSPRKVGAVMATLGFGWKRRTNIGWTILLDRADQVRVHKLVESHGMDLNLNLRLLPTVESATYGIPVLFYT